MCAAFVCLLYVCICGCFVNGVCIHDLAVVEALWRPTGISVQSNTWEPGVEGYLAMGKFPAYARAVVRVKP